MGDFGQNLNFFVLVFFLIRIRLQKMGETRDNDVYDEELVDYEEEDDKALDSVGAKVNGEAPKK